MVRKLVLASIVLIAAGLVLIVISDTALRAVTGTPTFPRTGSFTPGNFTSGQTPTFRQAAAGIGVEVLESLVGIGLVGGGLLLEVFSALTRGESPQVTK